ncbi:MAG: zinc permease [Candidatus Limnocylindrales bacterium]|jgi:ZIP family zinc transporter
MSFAQTVILAAFAGGTIFLGLPVGRLRGLTPGARAALTTAAAGVVLFLIYDVLSQAVEPVNAALEAARTGSGAADFVVYAAALGGSVAFGLLSVTYVMQRMHGRAEKVALSPRQVALGTATGLGLHNFSEGLAIGQSAATGATTLALILVIGFALHNATEGFAIGAPLGLGERPSWGFLALAGGVGGGPTFLGSLAGYVLVSPVLSILFLGLAAGALVFVFNEMMAASRRFSLPMVTGLSLTLGLLVAFGTDFVLSAAGA